VDPVSSVADLEESLTVPPLSWLILAFISGRQKRCLTDAVECTTWSAVLSSQINRLEFKNQVKNLDVIFGSASVMGSYRGEV